MQHFRFLGQLPTFDVVARLHKHSVDFDADGMLVLRNAEGVELPLFQQWKSLKRLLRTACATIKSAAAFGEILVDRLDPGVVTDWSRDASSDFYTLCVPLVTNPQVQMFARNESIILVQGALIGHDTLVQHCHANWSTDPAYVLFFQVEKPPQADVPDV